MNASSSGEIAKGLIEEAFPMKSCSFLRDEMKGCRIIAF